MKTTRRSFIKQVTGGIIGTWALISVPETSRARYIISNNEQILPEDELFWKVVREQFPLTHDRIYLNNGTMGPSPFVVREAIKSAIDNIDISGEYGGWEVARPKIAKFVNVDESEISLTHNVTEGINVVAWGLPLKKGDEVILTTHEHAGNALPWLNRAKYDGIVIKTLKPAQSADENLNRINDLITKRTRAIAIPHITCTIGQIFPAKEISKLGHDKNLWVFFDGAHGPGMTMLDLKDMDCDFYATCCHKWMCGPKGTGFLYVRKELLDVLQAKWIGGGSDIGWDMTINPPEFKGYVDTAHRYDFATQNAAIYIGVGSAIDFLYHIGMDNIVRRGKALSSYLQQELMKMDDKVEMLTPTEDQSRGFIVGFRLKNMPYDKFGEHAAKKGFRIRLVPENKLDSIRISTHIYNSFEEVNKFLELVKEV
ncbi:MAG: aminotransferase class V-fold PLP-dependent enzyme [Bacteroidota bacterium]|nr:aminotransferase class V-fold PLP-dependent enzyme [Bacteroidota bacterium]